MGDDQVVLGVDGGLNVVADHAGTPAARRHRAGIGIAQRDLLVRARTPLDFKRLQAPHLLLEDRDLVGQTRRLGRARQRRLLPVGAVQLVQIARNARLDLRHPPRHLGPREVPVPAVDRLELTAIDRHARLGEQPELPAQRDEPGADLADRTAVVLAEVGDRLVIRRQPADQPHHFHIAPGLPLEPTARLNPVEIAVDVELQQIARMIGRPAGRQRLDPVEPEAAKIELIDEDVDRPNRVVVADPVFQALRKQRALAAIDTLDKTLHQTLPPKHERIITPSTFLHSLGHLQTSSELVSDVRFGAASGPRTRGSRNSR